SYSGAGSSSGLASRPATTSAAMRSFSVARSRPRTRRWYMPQMTPSGTWRSRCRLFARHCSRDSSRKSTMLKSWLRPCATLIQSRTYLSRRLVASMMTWRPSPSSRTAMAGSVSEISTSAKPSRTPVWPLGWSMWRRESRPSTTAPRSPASCCASVDWPLPVSPLMLVSSPVSAMWISLSMWTSIRPTLVCVKGSGAGAPFPSCDQATGLGALGVHVPDRCAAQLPHVAVEHGEGAGRQLGVHVVESLRLLLARGERGDPPRQEAAVGGVPEPLVLDPDPGVLDV